VSERYARPALGRDEVRRACRKASLTALDYAKALVALEDPDSDVLSLAGIEEEFALRCREVTWAVAALPYADRPKAWREVAP
jgi:hypothetical protein